MSRYPVAIDTLVELPKVVDNLSLVSGSVFNKLRDAVIAVETELGIKPSGIYSTVRSRLNTIETAVSNLQSGIVTFSGDVSSPSVGFQKVTGLQGIPIDSAQPDDGYVLTYDLTSNTWKPAASAGGSVADGQLSVDLTGGNQTVSTQTSKRIIKATGTPGATRTITLPAPTDDATTQEFLIHNTTDSSIIISTGTGQTVFVEPGAKFEVLTTTSGVLPVADYVLDPRDFGCPWNGFDDDLPGLQAMIASIPADRARKTRIQLPKGMGYCSDNWEINRKVEIIGHGKSYVSSTDMNGIKFAPLYGLVLHGYFSSQDYSSTQPYGGRADDSVIRGVNIVSTQVVPSDAVGNFGRGMFQLDTTYDTWGQLSSIVQKGSCCLKTGLTVGSPTIEYYADGHTRNTVHTVMFRCTVSGSKGTSEPALFGAATLSDLGTTIIATGGTAQWVVESIPKDYVNNTTMAVGQRVFLPGDNDHVFECVNAGTTIALASTTVNASGTLLLSTITVVDTTDFPSSGVICIVSTNGRQFVKYAGKTPTTFTGCSNVEYLKSSSGDISIGDAVTGPYPYASWGIPVRCCPSMVSPAYGDSFYDTSTVIASGSDGVLLPTSTINVNSTLGFASSGTIYIWTGSDYATINYTGITSTSFTGCTGGTGTLTAGSEVGTGVKWKVIAASGITVLANSCEINDSVISGATGASIWITSNYQKSVAGGSNFWAIRNCVFTSSGSGLTLNSFNNNGGESAYIQEYFLGAGHTNVDQETYLNFFSGALDYSTNGNVSTGYFGNAGSAVKDRTLGNNEHRIHYIQFSGGIPYRNDLFSGDIPGGNNTVWDYIANETLLAGTFLYPAIVKGAVHGVTTSTSATVLDGANSKSIRGSSPIISDTSKKLRITIAPQGTGAVSALNLSHSDDSYEMGFGMTDDYSYYPSKWWSFGKANVSGAFTEQLFLFPRFYPAGATWPSGATVGAQLPMWINNDRVWVGGSPNIDPQALGFSSTEPASGHASAGSVIFNKTPSAGNPLGWTCTTAGTPGTWAPIAGGTNIQTTIAMADTNQTVSDVQTASSIISTTGSITADRTLTLPAPTGDSNSYYRVIHNNCTGTAPYHVVVSTGTGTTVSILNGQSAKVGVDTTGVFTLATPSVMPGYVDIRDYGAVPSPKAGPYTDCTDAFLAAIQAASLNSAVLNNYSVVYVPPCGSGNVWYVAGKTTTAFGQPHVEVSRAIKIMGVSTGRAGISGSIIKLGPGCCFRFPNQYNSLDGGDSVGAFLEGIDFICTDLVGTGVVEEGWRSNHNYNVGDKIRPTRFHALYYECIQAGTSNGPTVSAGDCSRYAATKYRTITTMSAQQLNIDAVAGTITRLSGDFTTEGFRVNQRILISGFTNAGNNVEKVISSLTSSVITVTDNSGLVTETGSGDELVLACGNRWRPGKSYNVGDIIYPNTECGYVYRCTIAGTTLGEVYGGDSVFTGEAVSEMAQASGQPVPLGEPAWFTDEGDPRGTTLTAITEQPSGPTWTRDVIDPEPLWRADNPGSVYFGTTYTPNTVYQNGARVKPTTRNDKLFIADTGGIRTSKLSVSEPAGFSGNIAFTDTDGITWNPISPIGLINDGTVVWAARFAGAILINDGFIEIGHFSISFSTTAGLALVSDQISTYGQVSDFALIHTGYIYQCGVGTYTVGPDSNASRFHDLFYVGVQDWWGDTAEHAFFDWSFLGNYYDRCTVQASSGYAMAMMSQGNSGTISSCYFEGIGRKSPCRGSVVIKGGTFASSYFRSLAVGYTSSSLDGGIAFGAFTDQLIGVKSYSYSGLYKVIAYLKTGELASVFGFAAEHQTAPGTDDDPSGYAIQYGGITNWWSLQHSNSYAYSAFLLSGEHASIGRGHLWFRVGFLGGATNPHYRFLDEGAAPATGVYGGVRQQGDVIERPASVGVGRYYYRINLDNSGGKYAQLFQNGATYNVGDIVVPTNGNETQNHRAFQVTTGGTVTTEPNWQTADTLGATVSSNGVVFQSITGADFRFAALIEDGKVSRSIQTTKVWADSSDTASTCTSTKTKVRERRFDLQTTTNVLQDIDAGGIEGGLSFGEDFTIPSNSMMTVEWTIILKKPSTPDGGSIKVSATFVRDGANPIAQIGTDSITYNLSGATLAATTVQTAIDGTNFRIKLQATPQTAETLNWRIFRKQHEGLD